MIVKSYISVILCHFSAFIDMSYENHYLYRTSHFYFYLNMKLFRDTEKISFVLVLYQLNTFCVLPTYEFSPVHLYNEVTN